MNGDDVNGALASSEPSGAPRPRRPLRWVIAGLGALVAVLLVVAVVLFVRSNANPTAAVVVPSASASPAAPSLGTAKAGSSATTTPTSGGSSTGGSGSGASGSGGSGSGASGAGGGAGHAAAPTITRFQVTPTAVTCSTGGPAQPAFTSTPLAISWSSTGGAAAYIGVDTTDAAANPYEQVAPDSGSVADIDYTCFDDQTYTLTVVGADGAKVSKTVTVTNHGDHP